MTTSAGQPTPTPDLAGLLSRRPPPAKTSPAVDPIEPTAISSAAEPMPHANLAAVPPAAVLTTPPPRQYLRSITVYLPRNLFIALSDAAAERDTSRTALILTAINSTHNRLGAVLSPLPAGGGDLFDVPQNRKAARGPAVQTTMRVTDAQLEALSELAKKNTSARSHVIAAAISLYLAV